MDYCVLEFMKNIYDFSESWIPRESGEVNINKK